MHSVARHLWDAYGEDIGSLTVLLPNNRSRVFFVDALSQIAGRPIFAPRFISIDSLMCELAGIGRIDHIRAIAELYKIYSQYHTEDFDSFYHWGEVLLADFDTVDKYRVNADMLFTNISDLKDMDSDLSYLSAEQIEAIKRFWGSFDVSPNQPEHQKTFLTIWNTLLPIYHQYRERLSDLGVGYSGMIYRQAAELLKEGVVELPTGGGYAVVGFNALSTTEMVLFDYLQTAHEALFYWDYDDYYLKDDKQEAGLFIRQNLLRYPAPADFVLPSYFGDTKEINVVATASDSLQTKYATEFIDQLVERNKGVDKRTAIVLTNEALLSPLLYSLPSGPDADKPIQYNVTMGYPLRSTLAYSFVERLLLLQQRVKVGSGGSVAFYHTDVEGLLIHPFVVAVEGEAAKRLRGEIVRHGRIYVSTARFEQGGELVRQIFSPNNDATSIHDYLEGIITIVAESEIGGESKEQRGLRRECFGLILEALTKSRNSLAECATTIQMKFTTYVSLLRKVLQGISIPYKGEPLSGVQVMGILETRNLDFDNVLLLSMSDDNFPSGRIKDISFIPFNLRMAYGLPTPHHSEGVYAYYFYRLLQRARRVDMVYCSVGDKSSSGEQSRYIYQLDFESDHHINRIEKVLGVNISEQSDIVVEKRGEVAERLAEFLDEGGRSLSPSALNRYIQCPLMFYFASVARLKVEDEISEDVDNSLFGTIFHRAAELLYKELDNKSPHNQQIGRLRGTKRVSDAVERAISEKYYGEMNKIVPREEYEGQIVMICSIIEKYLNDGLLKYDSSCAGDFRVAGAEYKIAYDFGFGDHVVRFNGTIDRFDVMADGRLRIVDYKTGTPHKDFVGIANLFEDKPDGHALQTLLYSMMVANEQQKGRLPSGPITPVLYYVRNLNNEEYVPYLRFGSSRGGGKATIDNYDSYADEFREALAAKLTEVFDCSRPFVATSDPKACEWCDYAKLCGKK